MVPAMSWHAQRMPPCSDIAKKYVTTFLLSQLIPHLQQSTLPLLPQSQQSVTSLTAPYWGIVNEQYPTWQN